jgi:hypothetical protein
MWFQLTHSQGGVRAEALMTSRTPVESAQMLTGVTGHGVRALHMYCTLRMHTAPSPMDNLDMCAKEEGILYA